MSQPQADENDGARCSAERALAVLEGRWKLLILRELFVAPRRFGELQRGLNEADATARGEGAEAGGVSAKVLAQSLREMERDGIVSRTAFAEIPPRVEYALTEHGRSLKTVLAALHQWGKNS
jgi:DNA-binding HxlR family transcriptional regulator